MIINASDVVELKMQVHPIILSILCNMLRQTTTLAQFCKCPFEPGKYKEHSLKKIFHGDFPNGMRGVA